MASRGLLAVHDLLYHSMLFIKDLLLPQDESEHLLDFRIDGVEVLASHEEFDQVLDAVIRRRSTTARTQRIVMHQQMTPQELNGPQHSVSFRADVIAFGVGVWAIPAAAEFGAVVLEFAKEACFVDDLFLSVNVEDVWVEEVLFLLVGYLLVAGR